MTLKDKKNNREYNRKLKAEGGTSSNATNKENTKKKEPKKEKQSSNFTVTGVTETADKLIEDANKRFENEESGAQVNVCSKYLTLLIKFYANFKDATERKYAKRNITSNWAKYDIPPEGEDEDEVGGERTGPEFEFVLASAQGAQAHFKFRCEQEWEKQAESIGDLSQEFFSLDVSKLESEIKKVPFNQQIGLSEAELVPEFQALISKKTEDILEGKVIQKEEVEKELNQKVMNILSLKSPTVTEVINEKKSENTLSSGASASDKTSPVNTTYEAPLEQRKNRRQRHENLNKSNDGIKCDSSDDLKFIEELEKEKSVEELPTEDTAQQSDVVTVKITSGETQNLEDWLDDFLDD